MVISQVLWYISQVLRLLKEVWYISQVLRLGMVYFTST